MSDLVTKESFRYSWEEKADAAKKYMLNGNMRIVSEVTGIPYDTLTDWKRSDWWGTLIDEIKAIKKTKVGIQLENIIDSGLELVEDRIQNGDFVLNNKTGEIVRKPITLRDASQMINALMARQIQMEELSERMDQRKETVQETLNLIAKEFTKQIKRQQNLNAVDVEVKEIPDAVHDEREERLQEGSS